MVPGDGLTQAAEDKPGCMDTPLTRARPAAQERVRDPGAEGSRAASCRAARGGNTLCSRRVYPNDRAAPGKRGAARGG
jgi:hypothetical protein